MKDQTVSVNERINNDKLSDALHQACKKIAPVWPLENFVAVNPYLGLTNEKFDTVAQQLALIGGIQMTMPLSFYQSKIREGLITREDLTKALSEKSFTAKDTDGFIKDLSEAIESNKSITLSTLTDVATRVTQKDWNRFTISSISNWAAAYFDTGQALWQTSYSKSNLFKAWKFESAIDLTPEVTGLKNFRKHVKALPECRSEAVQYALEILDVSENILQLYLHRLLLKIGGWSAYVARLDWESKLYGGKDGKLIEFLSVLICWEACLFQSLDTPSLRVKWIGAKKLMAKTKDKNSFDDSLLEKLALQRAFDHTIQREIIAKINDRKKTEHADTSRLKAQAIFCIDVRSEVYRRNLEWVDSEIETFGFAGFFGFPINYVPLGHDHGVAQCPVLIKTGPTILEKIPDDKINQLTSQRKRLRQQINKIWKSFRSGAVSCFSFVSPLGLYYLPKLITDSFGLTRPVPHPDKDGLSNKLSLRKSVSLDAAIFNNEPIGISHQQRVQMARTVLQAMTLTENFANFVLIVGHGSTTVNNPHATALDCGACGGHTGEANAKVAAAILNDPSVRMKLSEENIYIPQRTVFLACLHDTTTDEITIFNEHEVASDLADELRNLKNSLREAGHATRNERALKMKIKENVDNAIKERSKDWSQVRPEWGLAGCSAFVVAPRNRTKNVDFGGRSFLHSYEWQKDKGFSILELIMTAPMVVTSWINLQYYASTVDNKNFGSGNKTLHNVTSGVGVLEGYSGDLRIGLPIQSVCDGETYQHEPVKLNVIIEAPIEAMNAILEKHENVRNLCDNEWIHLLAMNSEGKVSHRYIGNLNWKEYY